MGFLELVVIAIVGLLVIGPEKLPDTIKEGVVWFTRIKRAINNTRTEVEQQLGMDEIRRELHNEQIMESLNALKIENGEMERYQRSAEEIVADVNKRLEEEKLEELMIGEQVANHGERSILPDTVENTDSPASQNKPENNGS